MAPSADAISPGRYRIHMARVSVSRTYEAPNQTLWNIFADYGNVADFHPGIVESRVLKQKKGVGGSRACEFGKGKGVDETITTWKKGKQLTFSATAFRNLPMKVMDGHFHFEGDDPTTITFVLDYKMKGGPLMDLMARSMMKKAGTGMLEGVKTKL